MSPDRAEAESRPAAGAFVAVVGPSGVGKDTLLSRAARHSALRPEVSFTRRVITRPALVDCEDHDCLDDAAFARAKAAGAFCLTWNAHELRYGLPRAIGDDLDRGRVVVANLSRRALAEAAAVFGRLWIIEITAPADMLLERLVGRGREHEAMIRERLDRHVEVDPPAEAAGHIRLDNSGDIESATEALVHHINAICEPRNARSDEP